MKLYNPLRFGSLALTLCLSGCSSTFFSDNSNLCVGENGIYQRCGAVSGNVGLMADENTQMHQLLPEYVEQLAMRLVDNMQIQDVNAPIAIASFVSFESNFEQGDLIGNQLAELFYAELQQFDLVLADHKARDFIDVTPTGDFNLSKDISITGDLDFGYVLTGVWLKAKTGIVVNARIIGLHDQKVVAAANTLIPTFVLPMAYR